jgi:hypothetical protein
VVIGELIDMARAAGTIDQWRAPIMSLWHHPIVGGSGTPAPLLAALGKMSWLIGCSAAAIVLRAKGNSLLVVGLLVISGLGLYVFMTHAWPGGPVTFGALGLAALLERRTSRAGLDRRRPGHADPDRWTVTMLRHGA